MAHDDPLSTLLVDEALVAREELAVGLAPFVQFTRDGDIWPLPPFEELPSRDKVLCLLLAVKAMSMLDIRETEQVSPAELVKIGDMAAGTVRPKLSQLVEKRLVMRDGHRYWISARGARKAFDLLGGSSGG
jgi:hypothetical protein